MNKTLMMAFAMLTVALPALANNGTSTTKTPIKFPIVEKQYPDIHKTIKAPTVFWNLKDTTATTPKKNHIISPLFYYQQASNKK